ncbi:MAG: hypothetical protein CW346_06105 [Bacillaceae bacterium]|nr:hypothetical protein [Bacillaceae bacterium]
MGFFVPAGEQGRDGPFCKGSPRMAPSAFASRFNGSAAAAVRQGGTHVGGRLGTFETFSQEWTTGRGFPENYEYAAYIYFK